MPERFALIIANSQFSDPKLARLVAPNKDAEMLKRVLEDPKIGRFHVTLLVDAPYTEIRREIARLYEGKTRSDLLLLYYSGHGIKDDAGDLYLTTKETQTDLISALSIEADFVRARLEKSNSQRKVIILDCCHSGAFMRGSKGKPVIGDNVDTQAAFAGSGYGWGILTASNAIEYAWEDNTLPVEVRASVFTRFLVEGLQSGAADLNHDGEVSLQELYNYIHEQVRTSAGAKQTPLMWQKAEGQIIIAQNPHPVVEAAIALPQELQQAIDNPLAGVRAGAVIELQRLLQSPNTSLTDLARAALTHLTNDDSRSVSQAATAALGSGASAPVTVPAPERHPSLGGDLRPSHTTIDVGQEATWTFTLRNDGDTDLYAINVRHGTTLLLKPFDLKVSETKQVTFTTSYPTSGRKTEEVVAATTSGGISVEHTATARVSVQQPKPALHPGLKLALSADAQVVNTGEEVRWSIILRNSGDADLRQVMIHFADQQKGEPFDLLQGRERRFTFGRTYNTAGEKSERVVATGIASDGSSARDEVQATITAQQAKQPQATPQETLREPLKALAKALDEEQTIQCPICDTELKTRNLVRHFDKVHAEDTSMNTAAMRKKIEAATSKATTSSESAGGLPGQLFRSDAPRQYTAQSTTPADKSSRAYFKMLMDSQRPDTQLQCPICNATLLAKNLLWHFDRRHAENASEPTQIPVASDLPAKTSGPAIQEYNITRPIVLKLMRVPAGEFLMGSDPAKDKAAQSSEQPRHRVNLTEYYISAYPVTNTQYEVFVKATGYAAPQHWKRTFLKPKIPSGVENQAITYVSWYDAVAFCQWLSKETGQTFRLPTEAEWEKAARGTDGRIAFQRPQKTWAIASLTTHELISDSPYGCMNMMDGIMEWTSSLYWTYPYNASDGRENQQVTGARVIRGSKVLTSFTSFTSDKAPRYAEREGYEPAAKVFPLGFRVAMVPALRRK